MFAVALIVFRESLEAALIISIVLAASVGVPGRGAWVAGGTAAGVLGAMVVAVFAAAISGAFAGSGQEVLNAAVLLLAASMCGWHNIWMASHARTMVTEARGVGRSVAEGSRPLIALAAIPASAVLREGAETVLFIYGIATGTETGATAVASGTLAGVLVGAVIGAVLYLGLLRIPVNRLFGVTGWMILFLAAGLSAQAMAFLVQADLVPALGNQVWDTSFILSEDSVVGRLLHTLAGYVAQPQGVQVLAYIATLALIGVPMLMISRQRAENGGIGAIPGKSGA